MDKKRVKEFMKTHKKEIFAMALTGFIGGIIGSHIGRRPRTVIEAGTRRDLELVTEALNSGNYICNMIDDIPVQKLGEVGELFAKRFGCNKNTFVIGVLGIPKDLIES